MKKALALVIAVLMAFSCTAAAFAEAEVPADSCMVYVTIGNKGELALAHEEVTVTDIDSDGALTVNDALYCAHEAAYEGGAAAGYESAATAYGLSLTKLWGDTNNGGFGYYVNNVSSWSLADPVTEGDNVVAFLYKDTTGWSDAYSFFESETAAADQYGTVTVTLSKYVFDSNYIATAVPVANAEITLNGEGTGIYTDENGKAAVEIDNAGKTVVSAASPEDSIITAPVCVVTAEKAGIGATISHYFNVILSAVKGIIANIMSIFSK